MPNKYTGPRRQNGPRTRAGCVTCKIAHVKCGEEKPSCRRCKRLKLECRYEFTLLWEEDAVRRGIVHGRQGVWSRDSNRERAKERHLDCRRENQQIQNWQSHDVEVHSWSFVNVDGPELEETPASVLWNSETFHNPNISVIRTEPTVTEDQGSLLANVNELDEVILPDEIEEADTELELVSTRWPVICENLPFAASALSTIETQLMGYYVHALAPQCSLRTDLNPYVEVLLPVAHDFAPLRHMLLAASACQLFHHNGEKQYEVQSLNYRSKALRGLNDHLRGDKMDWKSLATMAMFCFRDITDGSDCSWLTHLQMGLRMLRGLKCNDSKDSDLKSFCEIYFVAHEVMGRTGWDHDISEMNIYEWKADERYREINAIMGCSRELIYLISQITSLAQQIRSTNSCLLENKEEATFILDQIKSLHQDPGDFSDNVESMLHIAEMKRLSALLYLHNRIVPILTLSAGSFPSLPPIPQLQDSIISYLRALPSNSGAALWPLFVLWQSRLTDVKQVNFVLERLQQLETSRYLGNVYHVRKRIERDVWAELDESALQHSGEESDTTSLTVMRETQRWISLA